VVVCAMFAAAAPIPIDPPLPAPGPGDPPSPWHSLASQQTITFAFMTSWDGITWSEMIKTTALAAIADLDNQALPYHSLAEGNTDFTLRWAGADFFRDWRDDGAYTDPGWDLTNPLAVAYKHNNGPWDHGKYPNNEIYFNTGYDWSYSLFSVDPAKYDFWTVLQHEIIHMLACDAHAIHPDEIMYPTIDKGIRRYIQESDKDILRDSGYTPEPGTIAYVVIGLVLLAANRRRWTARQ
jgi:hypothetical protein